VKLKQNIKPILVKHKNIQIVVVSIMSFYKIMTFSTYNMSYDIRSELMNVIYPSPRI
jgi:hypothetical protein